MPTRKPKRTNWRQRAESAEAQVEQLVGDIQAVSQDYTDAKKALDAAERHNAELLKERDEWGVGSNCDTCGVELSPQITRVRRFCANGVCAPTLGPKSWLRRNWVELTVMATVLGAIAFVVWRAWR